MSLDIRVGSVESVLLADGWHDVDDHSFDINQYEFSEGDDEHDQQQLFGSEGIVEKAQVSAFYFRSGGKSLAGPMSALLAVRYLEPDHGPSPVLLNLAHVAPDDFHNHHWDLWRLNEPNCILIFGDDEYDVDLEQCTTSAGALDWIMQVTEKSWATPAVLSGLCKAINDVLRPQETLCGFGGEKKLSKDGIRQRVHAFAKAHPEMIRKPESND